MGPSYAPDRHRTIFDMSRTRPTLRPRPLPRLQQILRSRARVPCDSLNSVMHEQPRGACQAGAVQHDGDTSRHTTGRPRSAAAVAIAVGLLCASLTISRTAYAQVGVDVPAVTGLGGETVPPAASGVTPPTAPTETLATIPTVPAATSPQISLGNPVATTSLKVSNASRRTTTTKRRATTTRRGAVTASTAPPSTVLVLDPLQPAASTVEPIEVGAPETGTPTPAATGEVPSTLPPVTTAPKPGASSSTGPTSTLPAANPAELKARIEREIALSGGAPGVLVLVDGQKIADIGSTQARLPASTQKLYVASAALALLGGDYRFETTVRSDAHVGGVVQTLTLVAAGDPSFSTSNLRSLAVAVKSAGISSVAGRLTVDDSRFDRAKTAPGWKPSFSPGESGILNALMIDGNHRNDAVFNADPALANLMKFQQELLKVGITLTGVAVLRASAPVGGAVVASHRSEPLSALLATMGKKSNNTYAEMLLKEIGAVSGGGGSTAGGTAAIASHLAQLGVMAPTRIADGSGLSSLNRTTAASEVSLLLKADSGKQRTVFRAALPVACIDGTMKARFCGTSGSGVVIAKTGTIDNVSALSGYAVTASGRKVVFSFLLNGLRSSGTGRLAIDRAMLQVLNYIG